MRLLRFILMVAACVLLAVSHFAKAQTNIAPWLPVGGTATLAVSNISSTVALPWFTAGASQAASAAWVCNKGTKDAYVLMVATSTAAVTTSTGFTVFAGVCNTLAVQNLKYIAGITGGSDTTTLAIQTGSGTPVVGLPGGAGGGSAGTCAALAGDVIGPCSATVVSTIDGFAVSVGGALTTGGVVNIGTSVGAFLTTPSSANLAAAVTDETGAGALVFGMGPALSAPVFSGTSTGTWTLGGTPTFNSTTFSLNNGVSVNKLSIKLLDGTVAGSVQSFGATTIAGNTTLASIIPGAGVDYILASGIGAATSLTTADHIVALGVYPLASITDGTGGHNVGVGIDPMRTMTSGTQNTAVGEGPLVNVVAGTNCGAFGYHALYNAAATCTSSNAFGFKALGAQTTWTLTGASNSAFGDQSLSLLGTTGGPSSAFGALALSIATTGRNSAFGYNAGGNSTGTRNTLLGDSAGYGLTGNNNLVVGYLVGSGTCTTATKNILLGVDNTTDCSAAGETGVVHIGVGGGDVFKVTGGATPSTSVTTIAGLATITGAATLSSTLNVVTGYSLNGTAGITKTCTVIPTGITIQGGIITAITGGTCV